MGLRNSKPKRSKDNKIKTSVKNKYGQQMKEFTEQTYESRHSAKKSGKPNIDVRFQIKKKKNKSKIKCQTNGPAQAADESDTDNEDSTMVKTEWTEALIQDLNRYYSQNRSLTTSSRSFTPKTMTKTLQVRFNDEDRLYRNSLRYVSCHKSLYRGPSTYRCSSSDNNEEQISRMDKIIALGYIPYVPRRNRPAPPPPDLLE